MSDVFNEVDEELRKDLINRTFYKFLPLIIAIVLLIVGGVAGYQGWTWWQTKQKAEAAETYSQAKALLDAENYVAAKAAFETFSETGPAGYAALSKMQAAIASMKMGEPQEADRLFTEAASQFDDQLFSDMATLKAVMAIADEMSLAGLDARLGSLAGAGRPFRAIAREMMASKAMEEGDLARAREEYNFLSLSLDSPPGVQQRAQIALSLLGPAPEESPVPVTETTTIEPDGTPEPSPEETSP